MTTAKLFQKATRKQVRLRMALDGPSGAGKTFTGLRFAFALAGPSGKVAVVNTESGAIEKYLGLSPDGIPFEFDILTLDDYAPSTYTSAIQAAGREGYDVVLIDSLSHAWEGEGGALDQVDKKAEKNRFTAWKDVTPQHRAMIESILRSPCHVIATMRTKVEYVLEPDEKGRMVPKKLGTKPIQREGMEYEFDVVCDLDTSHLLKVGKTRCPEIDGACVMKPGAMFLNPVINWLQDGSEVDASFYAVTESDLRSLKPASASGTHLNAKEAMKMQAQVRASSQMTGSSSGPVAVAPEHCSSNEALHIRELFRHLGTPPEVQASILSRRNVNAVEELNADQASELIDRLQQMHAEATRKEQEEQKLIAEAEAQAASVPEKKVPEKKANDLGEPPQEEEVPF